MTDLSSTTISGGATVATTSAPASPGITVSGVTSGISDVLVEAPAAELTLEQRISAIEAAIADIMSKIGSSGTSVAGKITAVGEDGSEVILAIEDVATLAVKAAQRIGGIFHL